MSFSDHIQHRPMSRLSPWARKRGRLASLEPTTGRAQEQRCRPRRVFSARHAVPPAAYCAWIDDVPFPYAVGLLITPGNQWQLSLNSASDALSKTLWPHALSLLRALHGQQTTCQHVWKNREWIWQHNL